MLSILAVLATLFCRWLVKEVSSTDPGNEEEKQFSNTANGSINKFVNVKNVDFEKYLASVRPECGARNGQVKQFFKS